MSLSSIGDMRQHFLNMRNNTALKTDLGTLVEELTTGRATDLTSHLGSGQTRLSGLDRQLQMIDRFSQANTESGQLLSMMQVALDGVDSHRSAASDALLTIGASSSEAQISDAASIARAGLEGTVQALNTRFGDRAMFGGNSLDANPLASSDMILSELQTVIAGLTTATDVTAAIENWFDAPSGGFETLGYQGDGNGFMTRPMDNGQNIQIGVKADDAALRDLMASFAMGALAGDLTMTLPIDERQTLQQQAGVKLLGEASQLASIQGRLGYAQGQVEEASVRLSAQKSSLGIARNDLVSIDPFETATKLEQVQLQLETHYTLTARLSRLSLTEYLR